MDNSTIRNADLWQMLSKRRREILDQVQSRIHDGRSEGPIEGRDGLEHADADSQGEIEFTLLQAKADTLSRIDEALARLDAGTYGACLECDREISERRLRALPFAVRCQACEQRREAEQGNARQRVSQRSMSLFADGASS
jgi:DnaK suppressor protein